MELENNALGQHGNVPLGSRTMTINFVNFIFKAKWKLLKRVKIRQSGYFIFQGICKLILSLWSVLIKNKPFHWTSNISFLVFILMFHWASSISKEDRGNKIVKHSKESNDTLKQELWFRSWNTTKAVHNEKSKVYNWHSLTLQMAELQKCQRRKYHMYISFSYATFQVYPTIFSGPHSCNKHFFN